MDANRYFLHNRSTDAVKEEKIKLIACLRIGIHIIEKGLSLPEPRPGFGQKAASTLFKTLKEYIAKYGMDYDARRSVWILKKYVEYHCDMPSFPLLDEIIRFSTEIDDAGGDDVGIVTVSRAEVLVAVEQFDFRAFCTSRHSVRNFSKVPISIDKIIAAVEIAVKTPSSCNRQPWKTYLIHEGMKEKLLDIQGGCRSFHRAIDKVLLITSSFCFFGAEERHEAFTNGGMFAMSLIYALHAQGIGCCPLHTAFSINREKKLRHLLNIPDSEALIMMLGIGYLNDSFQVARSARISGTSIMDIR